MTHAPHTAFRIFVCVVMGAALLMQAINTFLAWRASRRAIQNANEISAAVRTPGTGSDDGARILGA